MHIKQNTPEWLEMRKNKIGASDAPVIMHGEHFGQTPYQLWEEKLDLRPPKVKHEGMQRGLDLEEPARHELEKMTGLFFLSEVKFHETIPWMMASVDAIDPENKTIAEIKCPNKEDHAVALDGKVPEKYIPQIQHQLEVCQLEMGYYFSFDGKAGVLLKFYRDDSYIKKMVQKEKEFWECLQEFSPPEMTERDYHPREEKEWLKKAAELLVIRETLKPLKELEKKEKELEKIIISMAPRQNSIGGGIKVTRIIRKGNVDYAEIPVLKEMDLEPYRKKSTEYYKISSVGTSI